MKADTRLFGEIDIKDDKIIKLKEGIIGFPDLQNFTLIHDEEKAKAVSNGCSPWTIRLLHCRL